MYRAKSRILKEESWIFLKLYVSCQVTYFKRRIMDLLEAVSCIFLAILKLVFIVVDFVFTFVGIKQLKGAPGKYILWVFIVIGCIYQLKKREDDYRDDAVLACVVTLNAYCVLRFVWKTYDEHVILSACKLSRLLTVYGKLRIFVYVLSVILAAVVVVNIADVSTTSVSRVFSEEIIGRLDNNILEIEEDRVKFKDVMVHPITRGEKYPTFTNCTDIPWRMYRWTVSLKHGGFLVQAPLSIKWHGAKTVHR